MTTFTATYSPEDNKLRLYASSRLDPETYARVRGAGFIWAPKQDLFVAPAWTPERAHLLEELADDIGDEDTSLCARAEARAERFEEYGEHRAADAASAHRAVSAIADNIPLGQPILIGHHSERHARRDAEKIENGMRRAVKMWETSKYWEERARGALANAKYKERPDVRARRIKKIEADLRRVQRTLAEQAKCLKAWQGVDNLERAQHVANFCSFRMLTDGANYWSAWDVLRPEGERYKACPAFTWEAVKERALRAFANTARPDQWIAHYENRLTYERAMLGESGGTIADKTGPEKGGACRCWASPRGGWSYIQKVNKVSVTVLDNWGNGGADFTRTIAFDKLAGIMTAAQVQEARDTGMLVHIGPRGFVLRNAPPPKAPAVDEAPAMAAPFEAMRETLAAGIQVVSAPQLFPTPRDLAARVVDLADIQPGHVVLEPSAGTGALLGAMGGRMFGHAPERGAVVAVEINPRLAEHLEREFPLTRVHACDFLAKEWHGATFDRIVMNPPFAQGADVAHIRRAFGLLKPGGRLVAICANGPRQRFALEPLASSWEDLPAGSFRESGTDVNAALLTFDKE